MAADLVLYTNPMSRGRIVRWMLEEVGAPYSTEIIEYGDQMKSASYLAINPMGKVPALRHGDAIVTETPAICTYLADAFPEAGLAPPPDQRAAYYRWLFFAAGPLDAAVTNRSLGVEVPADKERMVGYGTIDLTLGTIEAALSDSDYIAGDRFTTADICLGTHLGWGMHFGRIEPREAFKAYWERLSAREAYKRASALDDEALEKAS